MAIDHARLIKPVKKLRKLLKKLSADPALEEVHDLRTTGRRFEAALTSMALEDAGISKSALKELGRLRKRAGKVRDMDVLTELAAAVRPKGEDECHIRLLEHLGARRKKQAGKLHVEVKRHRSALRKELDRASSRMTKLLVGKGAGPGDSAAANAAATAVRLAAQLAAPARLNRTNLHAYRLKIKELQNILNTAETTSRPRFVEDLGAVKDAIGKWHDCDELVGIASKLLDHGGQCLLLAELKRIAERKYDHALGLALKLRKTYLQNAGRKRKNTSAGAPRPVVWEAMAGLAG